MGTVMLYATQEDDYVLGTQTVHVHTYIRMYMYVPWSEVQSVYVGNYPLPSF